MTDDREWFERILSPMPLSLDLVNEGTQWMVAAGAEHGPCAFDGWEAHA